MSVDQFPPFRPHPLIPGGHAQTVVAFYGRSMCSLCRGKSHQVFLEDGDGFVLHENEAKDGGKADRSVLLVPGLGGSSESPFMPRVSAKLNACGFRTFRMDLRGCGAAYHLARFPGHAGRSEDTVAAILKIAQLYPNSPVTAIGFSMGGNIVLKMLGETGSVPPGNLDSGVAVAPPVDILPCSQQMARLPYRLYSNLFVSALLQEVRRRRKYVEEMRQISLLPLPKTLMEFDDRFTAPLSGFVDARDYYERCSSRPLLAGVCLPTLVLAAVDDPVIPVSIFDRAEFSSSTSVLITDRGGHVGYLSVAGIDPDRRWMDWRIVDWIQGHHRQARLGGVS